MKDLINTFLGIVLVVAVSFFMGCRYGRRTAKKPVDLHVVWDTTQIIKHDTITREKPVYLTSYIHDTVRTYFTTIRHDTVAVDVPIERKVYAEDSLYRAVVSGWRPSLDSLVLYPKTTTITIHEKVIEKRGKIGVGATLGPGIFATPDGSVKGGIGVTAGVTYRF